MRNLKLYGGRVPIETTDPDYPVKLVDFPSWEVFCQLYGKRVTGENLERNYEILKRRASGAGLTEIGKAYHLTKERIRIIEARFLGLMRKQYAAKTVSQ